MSRPVYITNDHVLSPLGDTTAVNWNSLLEGKTGVSLIEPLFPSEQKIYGAVLKSYPVIDKTATKLENMMLHSIKEVSAVSQIDLSQKRLLVFISTVKGNIDLLGDKSAFAQEHLHMHAIADTVQQVLGLVNTPIIVSNACVSGVLAIQTATLYIKQGLIDHAIVCGGDLFSRFTLSGFYAFKALSSEVCRPFDKQRDGINLGEAVASVLLSANPEELNSEYKIKLSGVGSSNDANHISGPSRDGSGLLLSIEKATRHLNVNTIDFINAHGTGTLYNDNMESLAFQHKGLSSVPLNSLKAYYGHTLGAAGVLETIMVIQSMLHNTLIKSLGFEEDGTEGVVNVIKENTTHEIRTALKTASGFGGCNAALILERV